MRAHKLHRALHRSWSVRDTWARNSPRPPPIPSPRYLPFTGPFVIPSDSEAGEILEAMRDPHTSVQLDGNVQAYVVRWAREKGLATHPLSPSPPPLPLPLIANATHLQKGERGQGKVTQ